MSRCITGWIVRGLGCAAVLVMALPWVISNAASGPDPALPVPALRAAYERPPGQWPPPWIDAGVPFVELGVLAPPAPARGRERSLARWGARLFFDPGLAANGRVSCASCHQPGHAWTLSAPVGTGVGGLPGRRHPPSLHDVASRTHWAWDGRGASLQAQSLRPLTDPREMGNPSMEAVWRRLGADPAYADVLRSLPAAGAAPSSWLGEALAAFQRTLHLPSRLDRFVQGEHAQLSDLEVQGLHLFRTRARCANCHFGPTLSDGRFHNLGIAFWGEPSRDLGRHDATGDCEDAGRFRTPSLRHVARRAPYMHNGLFETLSGVLHLYQRGGGDPRARDARDAADPLFQCAARISPLIRPLSLSDDELAALRAFLGAL